MSNELLLLIGIYLNVILVIFITRFLIDRECLKYIRFNLKQYQNKKLKPNDYIYDADYSRWIKFCFKISSKWVKQLELKLRLYFIYLMNAKSIDDLHYLPESRYKALSPFEEDMWNRLLQKHHISLNSYNSFRNESLEKQILHIVESNIRINKLLAYILILSLAIPYVPLKLVTILLTITWIVFVKKYILNKLQKLELANNHDEGNLLLKDIDREKYTNAYFVLNSFYSIKKIIKKASQYVAINTVEREVKKQTPDFDKKVSSEFNNQLDKYINRIDNLIDNISIIIQINKRDMNNQTNIKELIISQLNYLLTKDHFMDDLTLTYKELLDKKLIYILLDTDVNADDINVEQINQLRDDILNSYKKLDDIMFQAFTYSLDKSLLNAEKLNTCAYLTNDIDHMEKGTLVNYYHGLSEAHKELRKPKD